MSVIIKGLEMPKTGRVDITIDSKGKIYSKTSGLPFWNYAAVEIPTPHGGLIDADEIIKGLGIGGKCAECKFWNGSCERGKNNFICDVIYNAPRILEGEE